MMPEAFKLWNDIETEAGTQLFLYVNNYFMLLLRVYNFKYYKVLWLHIRFVCSRFYITSYHIASFSWESAFFVDIRELMKIMSSELKNCTALKKLSSKFLSVFAS